MKAFCFFFANKTILLVTPNFTAIFHLHPLRSNTVSLFFFLSLTALTFSGDPQWHSQCGTIQSMNQKQKSRRRRRNGKRNSAAGTSSAATSSFLGDKLGRILNEFQRRETRFYIASHIGGGTTGATIAWCSLDNTHTFG